MMRVYLCFARCSHEIVRADWTDSAVERLSSIEADLVIHEASSDDSDDLLFNFRKQDRLARFDRVLVYGINLGRVFIGIDQSRERLWVGVTTPGTLNRQEIKEVSRMASSVRRFFTTSEDERSLLEAQVPSACGRTVVLPAKGGNGEVSKQWEQILRSRTECAVAANSRSEPVHVVIATHNAKFLGEVVDLLEGRPDVELQWDKWRTPSVHNPLTSLRRLHWADVVFCEWGLGNVSWYSRNIRAGQRLVCRVHGADVRSGSWIQKTVVDRVDLFVCVSEHYRAMLVRHWAVDPSSVAVISNSVDELDLRRPKLKSADFTLGLLGYVPFLKRPDRALDLLERLLETDDRYRLEIKGRPPWEYSDVWNDPLEKASYLDFYARIRESSKLRSAVRFTPFSADIATWLRGVGYILSPSDHESFHLSAAEGIASGSNPVVWRREGAEEIFGDHAVVANVQQAVDAVEELRVPPMESAVMAGCVESSKLLVSSIIANGVLNRSDHQGRVSN